MKRTLLMAGGLAVLCFASGAAGVFTAADILAGDGTPPVTRGAGALEDYGKAPLFASHTIGGAYHSSTFYSFQPEGEARGGSSLGVLTRKEGTGNAVGAYLYAENDGQSGAVWGANAIARTYNGLPAVGMEINGVNDSDRYGLVRGIDIVNGGTAPTQWGLGILTAGWAPEGQPRYGIVLGGPRWGAGAAPASRTGILIDHVDSGEALQIAAGDFITLDGERGRIRMRYNPEQEQIEFYNGDRLAHSIPM